MTSKISVCLALAVVALCCCLPASAFTPIPMPDAAYVGGTSLIPITVPDMTVINSLSDGTLTVGFSAPAEARTVPGSWATWGDVPFTEGNTPRIAFEVGQSIFGMTFSQPVSIFGFEAEPNAFGLSTMTANFYDGASLVGTIQQAVDGNAGARLFAASTTGQFTSVVFSNAGGDFAVARLRYSCDAPPSGDVPEFPSLILAGMGGLSSFLAMRRRKK